MIDNIKDTRILLDKISLIREKYNKINDITGVNYNVFNVLKLHSNEVVLHSRFIGDLLNPKGKHGRGDIFLKLFLKQVKSILPNNKDESICDNFRTPNAKIIVEEYIGVVKTDEGGRIDLVLQDGANTIVIENKIYAKDQNQQLIRYYNKYPGAIMVYLTLEGKKATSISVTSKKKEDSKKEVVLKPDIDYFRLSYEKNIVKWLEACIPYTTNFPFLRESINQYLNIVKQLTGQSINKDMDKEITNEMFGSVNSINASQQIAKLFDDKKKVLYRTFRRELQDKICDLLSESEIKFCLKNQISNKKWEEIKTQFSFDDKHNCTGEIITKDKVFKNKLIFEFSRMYRDGKVNNSFYFGFRYDNGNNNKEDYKKTNEVQKLINNKMLNLPNPNNDFGKYWLAIDLRFNSDSNDLKFNSPEFMVKLNNEKDRVEMVDKLANEMVEVIKVYINNK